MRKFLICLAAILTYQVTSQAQASDTLRVAAYGQRMPSVVDYTSAVYTFDGYLLALLAEGLLNKDASGNLVAGQAESWEASPDGLHYTFRLRENLKWSDGTPIEASNFVAAWRRIADPNKKHSYRGFLKPIKNFQEIQKGKKNLESLGIKAINKSTISIKLEKPSSLFLETVAYHPLSPIPQHINTEELEDMLSRKTDTLIVNGPYTLKTFSDSKILVQKNPYYWAKNSLHFDKISFEKKPNRVQSAHDVITGQADISLLISLSEFRWIKEQHPSYALDLPGSSAEFYWINQKDPILGGNTNVGKALSMSIDREEISHILREGLSSPAYTLAPKHLYDSEPPLPEWAKIPHKDRLQEARHILEAAGYNRKNPLKIELKVREIEGGQKRNSVATAISTMWKEIGVDARIIEQRKKDAFRDQGSAEYQVIRAAWFSEFNDPYYFLFLLGSGQTHFGGTNPHPEVDQWLKSASEENNLIKREMIYAKLEESLQQQVPLIPVYHIRNMHVVSPTLETFHSSHSSILRWIRRKEK